MRVIATAGHVDHGKSALLRALTGMEPDRWAEEQRRGMTIDLGYAWLTLPSGERLAFVDVPGHERFVPNMLAGVGPVAAVLFVVAADGGWMPQSAEHLAVLAALGIRHVLLAVTRCDLADPGPARAAAAGQCAAAGLGQVPAVAASAVTGQGLPELRTALAALAAAVPAPDPAAPVRLWVDRAFTVAGAGTVVTGTLPAGTVRRGGELAVAPAGGMVRVRGLQALGEPAEAVTGVARVALSLRGAARDQLTRGVALVQPGAWTLTSTVDVRLQPTSPGSDLALLRRRPGGQSREVSVHLGSARTVAQLRLLGPGLARLTLDGPLPLHTGDLVLLRDPGADGPGGFPEVLGAAVLDVIPPPLARPHGAAAAAAELAGWPDRPGAADLLRRHGLLRAGTLRAMGILDHPVPLAGDWVVDPVHQRDLADRLAAAVAEHAAADPLAPGLPAGAAQAAIGVPDRRLAEALAQLPLVVHEGVIGWPLAEPGDRPAPDHPVAPGPAPTRSVPGPAPDSPAPGSAAAGLDLDPAAAGLPAPVAKAVAALRQDLAGAPFLAPEAGRLRELGLTSRAVAAAARAGLLLRVSDQIVLGPDAAAEAAAVLAGLPQPFSTAQARQALGTTRRVAIPLLEYLDRAGRTQRLPDDTRRVR